MGSQAGTSTSLTRADRVEMLHPGEDANHAEIAKKVEASRQQIRESVGLIEQRLHERLDWRGWVRDHPVESVGIAFGIGVLLGARRYL